MKIINTGALHRKDIRNFKIEEVEEHLPCASVYPAKYLPDVSHVDIRMQSKQPACVGFAGAWLKTYLDWLDTGEVRLYSPRFLYALSKSRDGIKNVDGTYPNVMLSILKDTGICDEALYPNETELERNEYIDTTRICNEAYDNAQPRIIKSYVSITDKSFVNLKREIYRNKGVLLLLNVGKEFWTDADGNTSWDSKDLFPLRTCEDVESGHEVVAWGYTEDRIYIANSFSEDWGDGGMGYFDVNYIKRVREAQVMVDLPDNVVVELQEKRDRLMIQVIAQAQKLIARLKVAL